MNSFGQIFKLTTFGESHGKAIGGIIDGVPSNFSLDLEEIQYELSRRSPGQSDIVTGRKESDTVEFLSGIYESRTLGTPIGFIIKNSNQHSNDYEELRDKYRPGHADFTYDAKFGLRDHRGGGRSSARETASRVVAGAVAKQILRQLNVTVYAYTSQVGHIKLNEDFPVLLDEPGIVDTNAVRCPDNDTADAMIALIKQVKAEGDTVGGVITGVITGVKPGVGEPVFDKLQAMLGHAMLSINAVKGFEYGIGFEGASKRGSEIIDHFYKSQDGRICTKSNYSGGIQGGISNGEPITFRVGFKPVATLLQDIETIDKDGNPTTLKMRGRHDPCVVPRAVPIVEAMAAMTVLDAMMTDNARKLIL